MCKDCGAATRLAVRVSEGKGWENAAGFEWLCGSCEYRRSHPEAPKAPSLPRKETARLQTERLFVV